MSTPPAGPPPGSPPAAPPRDLADRAHPVRVGTGSDDSPAADAHITIGEIDAWKLFTRSLATGDRESRAGVEGDRAPGLPCLSTVSIIA